MKEKKRYKYFFSYKSEDIALVRQICEHLFAEKTPIWLNEYNIKHNQQDEFQELINEGIDQSEYGVLFITEKYARSPYCLLEVERLLRRLPTERIIPIVLENSDKFRGLYPELDSRLIRTGNKYEEILEKVRGFSKLETQIKPLFTPIEADQNWMVIEAGFTFNMYNLTPVLESRFKGSKRYDIDPGTGSRREEYHVFADKTLGIELLFDYEFYNSDFAKCVEAKVKQGDGIREANEEQDDRNRLIEEMQLYEREIEITIQRVNKSYQLPNVKPQDIEEVGVHMLSTHDQGIEYKHRMYTFGIKETDRIYRIVKLVIPHPIHNRAYLIRFIFSCAGPINKFFYYCPLYHKILESFVWHRKSEALSIDELSSAHNRLSRKE